MWRKFLPIRSFRGPAGGFQKVWLSFLAGLIVAGCSYSSDISNVFALRAAWWDYVGGEDLRDACEASPGQTAYRFIYNADPYGIGPTKQTRGFDLLVGPSGRGELSVLAEKGIGIGGDRGFLEVPRASALLSEAAVDGLERAMAQDGVFAPPPAGLRIQSGQYFWIVGGCRDGAFFLTAMVHPTEEFTQAIFPEVLRNYDPLTDQVAWPLRPGGVATPGACPTGRSARETERKICILYHIGENGLVR